MPDSYEEEQAELDNINYLNADYLRQQTEAVAEFESLDLNGKLLAIFMLLRRLMDRR